MAEPHSWAHRPDLCQRLPLSLNIPPHPSPAQHFPRKALKLPECSLWKFKGQKLTTKICICLHIRFRGRPGDAGWRGRPSRAQPRSPSPGEDAGCAVPNHHSLARNLSAFPAPVFLSKPLLRLFLQLHSKSKISLKSYEEKESPLSKHHSEGCLLAGPTDRHRHRGHRGGSNRLCISKHLQMSAPKGHQGLHSKQAADTSGLAM